jgi:N-acetylmuramoyl-L-alanine amidase
MPRLTPPAFLPFQSWVNHPTLWRGLAMAALLTASLETVALGQSSPAEDASQGTAVTYPTISEGRIVRPTLRLGNQGESVKELQAMLVLLGYFPGPVSGVYQEATETAVRRFQEAAGITPDGIVGPATWNSLLPVPASEGNPPGQAGTGTPPVAETTTAPATPTNPTPSPAQPTSPAPANPSSQPQPARPILRPGMEGDAVRQLQETLRSLGFYSGPIDGIFGSQTEAAVRRVQAENSLEVDGIVGPSTWNVLN